MARPSDHGRPRAAVVEARLRRLGSEDLTALVADLWDGRGFETSREGDLVVATRGRETVRIAVAGRRRLGTPSLPDGQADVIVAPGTTTAGSVAGDARVLDASDLREMLHYAVDRPTSRRLCERHLGGPPEELRPPLFARLWGRSRAVASRAAPAVALALVVLLGLGAVAGVAFAPDAGDQREPSQERAGPSMVPLADPGVPATAATANGTVSVPPDPRLVNESNGDAGPNESDTAGFAGTLRSPPGITDSGITNLTTLSAAHERVLADRSYTLRLERVQPVNPLWEQDRREIEIAVAGDRYLLSERRVLPDERSPVREVYYNGSAWHVVRFDGNGTIETVRQDRAGEATSGGPGPDPFALPETLVARYLSTPETSVADRIPRRNRTLTRIAASGAPPGVGGETVRNYSAVALVDDRGLVRNLTVEYTITTGPVNYTVRFEARYGELGETTVRAPRWHGRALPSVRDRIRVGGSEPCIEGLEPPGAEPSR